MDTTAGDLVSLLGEVDAESVSGGIVVGGDGGDRMEVEFTEAGEVGAKGADAQPAGAESEEVMCSNESGLADGFEQDRTGDVVERMVEEAGVALVHQDVDLEASGTCVLADLADHHIPVDPAAERFRCVEAAVGAWRPSRLRCDAVAVLVEPEGSTALGAHSRPHGAWHPLDDHVHDGRSGSAELQPHLEADADDLAVAEFLVDDDGAQLAVAGSIGDGQSVVGDDGDVTGVEMND